MEEELKKLCDTIRELSKIRKELEEYIVTTTWDLDEILKELDEERNILEEERNDLEEYRRYSKHLRLAIEALNILQFNFVDVEIISRIETTLQEISRNQSTMQESVSRCFSRLIVLVNRMIDSLHDVRLIVLENIRRGSGNEILSVRNLCSYPSVKVVSTMETIQKSITDLTIVLKEEKKNIPKIISNWNITSLRGPRIESDVLRTCHFEDDCLNLVTMAVSVTSEFGNSRSFEFKVVFISDKKLDVIPAEFQEGYVHFPLRPTKHIFIISTEKWDLHQLNRDGFIYKAVDFKDLIVTFPPDSVSKECEIEIQVLSPNQIELLERQDGDNFTDIVIVSPLLWIKHDDMLTFQKPVVITLPLLSPNDEEIDLCLFEWTESDEVYISETKLIVKNTICEFAVNGFCGLCIGKRKGKRKHHRRKFRICGTNVVKRGMPKECTILVFTDRTVAATLWVEIVECTNKEELLKKRSTQELVPIKNAEARPFTIRYGQKLSVHALGNIRISDHYRKSFLHVTFSHTDESNYLRFDVEILEAQKRAVLEFRLGNKQVHVCPFNAYRWLIPQNETPHLAQNDPGIYKNQVLHLKSLNVLVEQVPCDKVTALAIELNLSSNEMKNLQEHGHKGYDLTRETLLLWRKKCNQQEIVMINELASALNELSLKKLASIVLEASRANRPLNRAEFQEKK